MKLLKYIPTYIRFIMKSTILLIKNKITKHTDMQKTEKKLEDYFWKKMETFYIKLKEIFK